jgi:hypothetical protein
MAPPSHGRVVIDERSEYHPGSDKPAAPRESFEWWGKRLALLISLSGVLGASAAYAGVRVLGPGPRMDRLEDSIRVISNRADSAQLEASASAYVICELFKAMRPRDITPPVCSPERQRIRSTR